MRKYHIKYVAGTHKRECDVCGFDYRRAEMLKRWDGAIVCKEDYEEKHDRDYPHRVINERAFKGD